MQTNNISVTAGKIPMNKFKVIQSGTSKKCNTRFCPLVRAERQVQQDKLTQKIYEVR